VEPTVGSTPPWAGVTPAPSGEEKMRPSGPVRSCWAEGFVFFACFLIFFRAPSVILSEVEGSEPVLSILEGRSDSLFFVFFLVSSRPESAERRDPGFRTRVPKKGRAARNPSCRDLDASRYKENRFALREYSGQAPVFYSSGFRSG
jgi:hypothetical protein